MKYKFINEYESASWLDVNSKKLFGIKLHIRYISEVCNNKKPNYKGYIFRYAN